MCWFGQGAWHRGHLTWLKDSSSDSSAESKMSCIYLKQSSILKINDLQGREEKLLLCNAEKGPDDHSLGPFPDDVIISLNNKFLTMWKKKKEEEIKKKRGTLFQ